MPSVGTVSDEAEQLREVPIVLTARVWSLREHSSMVMLRVGTGLAWSGVVQKQPKEALEWAEDALVRLFSTHMDQEKALLGAQRS